MKLKNSSMWLRGVISLPRFHQIHSNSGEIWEEFIISFQKNTNSYVRKEVYASIFELTKNFDFLEEGVNDQSEAVSKSCKKLLKKNSPKISISKSLNSFLQ